MKLESQLWATSKNWNSKNGVKVKILTRNDEFLQNIGLQNGLFIKIGIFKLLQFLQIRPFWKIWNVQMSEKMNLKSIQESETENLN